MISETGVKVNAQPDAEQYNIKERPNGFFLFGKYVPKKNEILGDSPLV